MFDRFMVDVEAGRNLKLRRLTDSERLAFFLGVLPIAAKAPIRGRLLVGDLPAESRDIAFQASVSERAAAGAVSKLRALGVLLPDDELGCEFVHDFDDWNPAPKRDSTNAERQRRYRERQARRNTQRNGTRNGDVTAGNDGEVEGKGMNYPPNPPRGEQQLPPVKPSGNRQSDHAAYRAQLAEWTAQHFPGCQPSAIAGLIGWVESRGIEPTVDALREFAESAPNFAHVLEPAA